MAFKVIAPYIEAIEEGLRRGESPAAIAKRLGIPEKEKTISRYKAARFNPLKEARELWEIERSKTPEQRLAEGKAKIIDTLEVVNLAKLRAMQLLQLEVGTKYKTAGGEEREMSWPSVSSYWQTGARMICDLAKIEMELAGNDAESRKADAWVDLVEMIGDHVEAGADCMGAGTD